MLNLENFTGYRITNLNEAEPGKWRAKIRRESAGSDPASLQLRAAPQSAKTFVQDNDTPALNALKALRGAPISMGRGETPVGCCQQPSGFAILIDRTADAETVLAAISASAVWNKKLSVI